MDLCPAFAEFHLPAKFNDKHVVRILDSLACPDDVLVRSKVFKEEGNSLFRERKFKLAFSKYDLASKVLCFSLPSSQETYAMFRSLALNLNLNLAACALKLQEFDYVIKLCSFVLRYDSCHTKGLFRRALAFKGLDDLLSAKSDLCKVLNSDSRNVEVLKELQEIERLLGCASLVDLTLGEVASPTSEEVCGMEVIPEELPSGDHMDCDVVSPVTGTPLIVSDETISHDLDRESTPKSMKLDNGVHQHRFQSSGCFGSSLQITSSNLQRLKHGEVLSFYHSRSMSVMSVRVIPSKTQILTEVPLGAKSREAETSIPSVLPFCGSEHQAVPSHQVLSASSQLSTVEAAANQVSEELIKPSILQFHLPKGVASQGFIGSRQGHKVRVLPLPSRVSSRLNHQQWTISHSHLRTSGKMFYDRIFVGCRVDHVGSKRRPASSLPLDLESSKLARVKRPRIGPSWVFVT